MEVVEVVEDARGGMLKLACERGHGTTPAGHAKRTWNGLRLAMKADLDLAIARLEARFTRLLWLQLGAYTAAAVGAIVVAGVVWG